MSSEHLTERFGAITAFTRSPAQGTTTESGKPVYDQIVVFEVMTEALDVSWWRTVGLRLEREFRLDQIAIRASMITLLGLRNGGARPKDAEEEGRFSRVLMKSLQRRESARERLEKLRDQLQNARSLVRSRDQREAR